MGINEHSIKNASISDRLSLIQVKLSFRTKFETLMTHVLKQALQKDEEVVACILTAYYDVALTEEMLIEALAKTKY